MRTGSGPPHSVAKERSNLGDNGGGLIGQSTRGDPQHSVAGNQQSAVSAPVALERSSPAMVGVAVQLDYQALLWPDAVHLNSGNGDVHGRGWERLRTAESQKAPLELGPSRGQPSDFSCELGQSPRPPSPRGVEQQERERPAVYQSESVSLFEGPPQSARSHPRGEVEERAWDRGDRNRVDAIALPAPQAPRTVHDEPGPLVAAMPHGDVDRALDLRRNSPQHGGAPIADHGSRTPGERRGHV